MSDLFGVRGGMRNARELLGGLSFGEDISHAFKLIACGQLLLSRARLELTLQRMLLLLLRIC